MNYKMQSKELTVTISSIGGELQSIKDVWGKEYLWQGDKIYWGDRAPNIFPYVARLTKGQFQLEGKTYHMDIHGFVKDRNLECVLETKDKIVFQLCADETTISQYPYVFTYRIIYELKARKLEVTYIVENKDHKEMYFGIGGHPGFNLPMDTGLEFEDYYLEFAEPCAPRRIVFTKDCFCTGECLDYPLEGGRTIKLKHELFDEDAIVLEGASKSITLKSKKDHRVITVTYEKMDYIGFWHATKTKAPYLCIEPWSSLPSRKNVIEDLATQPGLVRLKGKQTYENPWSITIEKV